jgi:hypothetical protein
MRNRSENESFEEEKRLVNYRATAQNVTENEKKKRKRMEKS